VRVSAVKKTGIDDLLESIITLSEVLEVKANPNRPARGTVVEAKIDKGKGPVATVLVSRGTLRVGDAVYIGETCGKIRAMMDAAGKRITEATPSTPVEIQGLEGVPEASDLFYVVSDERVARDLATEAQQKKRESNVQVKQAVSLEGLFDAIKAGERKELPIVVKADVQGSLEALTPAIERLSLDEVQVKVIHGSVGPVTESDVMLAQASGAIIIGFNVRPEPSARRMAEQSNVDIRLYRIIYDCLNDIEAALKGMLAPVFREVVLGSAEVRQVFKITKVGTIAGCYVTEGKISRSAKVRIVRNGVEVFTGNIDSLKRFKDDAKEVAAGYECGIGIENYNDLKEGDRIEAYTQEQVQPA
jgi:translation initiation factor IF-2